MYTDLLLHSIRQTNKLWNGTPIGWHISSGLRNYHTPYFLFVIHLFVRRVCRNVVIISCIRLSKSCVDCQDYEYVGGVLNLGLCELTLSWEGVLHLLWERDSDVGRYVKIMSYYILFSKYFRYLCIGGKFKRTLTGLFFRNVVYARYDVRVLLQSIHPKRSRYAMKHSLFLLSRLTW
jgi:hypothetical protein